MEGPQRVQIQEAGRPRKTAPVYRTTTRRCYRLHWCCRSTIARRSRSDSLSSFDAGPSFLSVRPRFQVASVTRTYQDLAVEIARHTRWVTHASEPKHEPKIVRSAIKGQDRQANCARPPRRRRTRLVSGRRL